MNEAAVVGAKPKPRWGETGRNPALAARRGETARRQTPRLEGRRGETANPARLEHANPAAGARAKPAPTEPYASIAPKPLGRGTPRK